jgi:molecular chaperone DnaK (HSP70)
MTAPFSWMSAWDKKPVIDRPIRVIGIDLGTTNSTVTEIVWSPNSSEPPVTNLIQIPQETTNGQIVFDLVPSVVAIHDDKMFVGTGAQRLRSSTALLSRNKQIWWDTKNEIGTRRIYAGAPEGFRTPWEIAAKILKFLNEAAIDESEMPIDRVVVTVPASFQLTQRKDTINAAKSAGIELKGQDLMAEPVAAFLDFLTWSKGEALSTKKVNRVMVVDFGGGTCDIALLQLTKSDAGNLEVANKGVSRFHRIGGSDIDDVIAYEILLPKFLAQNEIQSFEINYKQKRDNILPVLASLAEVLKKKLSDKVNMQRKLGQFDEKDGSLSVSLPAPTQINTGHDDYGILPLNEPSLSLGEVQPAIDRFLNAAWIRPQEGEYFQATSIFAPINDVIGRAEWTKDHIDHILLVGGSSLYYGVSDALNKSFPNANLLTYTDPLDAQRCVGRGAAIQALLLTAYGESPLKSTLGDQLTINTSTGYKELIAANATLPFPSGGGMYGINNLTVGAKTSEVVFKFKVGDRVLETAALRLPPGVNAGTPIALAIQVDENQHFKIIANVAGVEETIQLDNPFSVSANPNADRDKILELEEKVLEADTESKRAKIIGEIALLHHGLGERERARQLFEGLLANAEGDRVGTILHQLGLICGEMKDVDAQVAYYRQALSMGFSDGIAFNLAMQLDDDGNHEEALEIIEAVMEKRKQGADNALRGLILKNLARPLDASEAFQACINAFPTIDDLRPFDLGWLGRAARETDNKELLRKIAELNSARKSAAKEAEINADDDIDLALPDWVV